MDCNKCESLLNAYVDQELNKSDRSLLEAHLSECSACSAELESIRRLDAGFKATVTAPEPLRSHIADRLAERASAGSSRTNLKEKFQMKVRWGLAATIAATLIFGGVMMTGGSAQATLSKMRKAVTEVHSAHLKIDVPSSTFGDLDIKSKNPEKNVGKDIGKDIDKDDDKDGDHDKQDLGDMIGNAFSGDMHIELWTKNDRWKMQMAGFGMVYKNHTIYTMMGDKVMSTMKVDKADVPDKLGEFLFKEFTKAMDEAKKEAKVRFVGTVEENGHTLKQLEITGIKDDAKNVRLLYWVDEETTLPTRFEVYAKGDNGEKLVTTISCEFNQPYPDSMFEPGSEKP